MGLIKKLAVAGIAAAVIAKVTGKDATSSTKKPKKTKAAASTKGATKPRRRKSRAKASATPAASAVRS